MAHRHPLPPPHQPHPQSRRPVTPASTGRTPSRPGTVPSRRSDLTAVTAAVRPFKTTNGRTPTFHETCALMGWTPHHTRQVLAATKPAAPKRSASPPPSTATGPAPTGPPPNTLGPPLLPEPLVAAQPGPIPLPPPDEPDARARRRRWHWLTAHHQVPTGRAVTARARDATTAHAAALRRQARSLEQASTAAAIAAAEGPRARQWIADYRAAHHQGPLWRELADAMGWTPLGWNTRQHIMTTLAAHGYLTYHPDIKRSLNAGPARPSRARQRPQ